jgi:protein-L-isoaspartate(D-aspartate) O-methyltransferase
MTDFAAARRMMVDGQVRANDVTDLRIIAAMLGLPRERFVPQAYREIAYLDLDIPVQQSETGEPRRLLKSMVLAKLVQAAALSADDQVLDVGCATGYSSALLARLARSVVALEEDAALAKQTEENIAAVGAQNVTTVVGGLTAGWPDRVPYDVIFINGAVEFVPDGLRGQLRNGGRLVVIEGRALPRRAMLYRSVAGVVSGWPVFDAAAPLLPGFALPPAFVF